jgi:hypothetical protein
MHEPRRCRKAPFSMIVCAQAPDNRRFSFLKIVRPRDTDSFSFGAGLEVRVGVCCIAASWRRRGQLEHLSRSLTVKLWEIIKFRIFATLGSLWAKFTASEPLRRFILPFNAACPKIRWERAPGAVENAFLSPPLGSVAVSAGYLLMTMCRVSPRSLADSANSENGPLMAPADWSGAKVAVVPRW